MPLKVVVVVPLSPSNSKPCWKCGETNPKRSDPLFCASCSSLQDLGVDSADHFEVLGIPESLKIDESLLRKQFYELSKRTHPDRFVNNPQPEPQYALRWTTAINRAYQTLRDKTSRSLYLVEKYLGVAKGSTQVPLELAETYFELQDLMSEGDLAPMVAFQENLTLQLKDLDKAWEKIATLWEHGNKKEVALQLKNHLDRERYLNSMLRDIERKLST